MFTLFTYSTIIKIICNVTCRLSTIALAPYPQLHTIFVDPLFFRLLFFAVLLFYFILRKTRNEWIIKFYCVLKSEYPHPVSSVRWLFVGYASRSLFHCKQDATQKKTVPFIVELRHDFAASILNLFLIFCVIFSRYCIFIIWRSFNYGQFLICFAV